MLEIDKYIVKYFQNQSFIKVKKCQVQVFESKTGSNTWNLWYFMQHQFNLNIFLKLNEILKHTKKFMSLKKHAKSQYDFMSSKIKKRL